MQRTLILSPLIFLAGFFLALPVIVNLGAPPDAGDAAATKAGGDPAPEGSVQIPTVAEAPPQWNAYNLVGTAWQATIARDFGSWDSEMVFMYSFNSPGRVVLRAIDPEIDLDPELSESRRAMRAAMLPFTEGSYEVENGTIHLRIRVMGREADDTIEIRGQDLYFSGVPMTRVQPFAAPS